MKSYKGAKVCDLSLEEQIKQNPEFADYYIEMEKIRKGMLKVI